MIHFVRHRSEPTVFISSTERRPRHRGRVGRWGGALKLFRSRLVAGIWIGLAAVGGAGADDGLSSSIVRRLDVMGTTLLLEIRAADRITALAASEAAVQSIHAIDERLSTWRPDTELHRLNVAPPGEWTEISPELAEDLTEALRWAARTGSAFDPVIGALVGAWDLRGAGAIPDDGDLVAALDRSGSRLIEIDGQRARKLVDGAVIDEGGFGKGVGLGGAVDAALAAGAKCVRADLGGQWLISPGCGVSRLSIAHPIKRGRIVGAFEIDSGSVATSGNSERGHRVDGDTVGHLIDPRSGRPAPIWGAVTVVADDPVAADCLATALYVMGPDAGLRWLEDVEGVEAVFAVSKPGDGVEFRRSSGFPLQSIGSAERDVDSMITSLRPEVHSQGPPN